LPDGKKTSAEEKDYDPGCEEGDNLSYTYPVCPEPTAGRKPPAPLAFDFDRVAIGCSLSDVPESADPVVAFFLEPGLGFLRLTATEAGGCFAREISSSGTIRDESN
jgi:hypothetical protein